MVAGMGKVNPPTGPGSHSLGFAYKTVIITGLTDDGRVVCKDNYGREVMVNASVQRAKGLPPQVGERWFIDRAFGGWSLAACLSIGADKPIVTGLVTLMDPASHSLLRALENLGLVDNQTYGIDVVPRDIHSTTFTTAGSGDTRTMHLVLEWSPPTTGTPDLYAAEVNFYDQYGTGPLTGSFTQGNTPEPWTYDGPLPADATMLVVTVLAFVGEKVYGSVPTTIVVPV